MGASGGGALSLLWAPTSLSLQISHHYFWYMVVWDCVHNRALFNMVKQFSPSQNALHLLWNGYIVVVSATPFLSLPFSPSLGSNEFYAHVFLFFCLFLIQICKSFLNTDSQVSVAASSPFSILHCSLNCYFKTISWAFICKWMQMNRGIGWERIPPLVNFHFKVCW